LWNDGEMGLEALGGFMHGDWIGLGKRNWNRLEGGQALFNINILGLRGGGWREDTLDD